MTSGLAFYPNDSPEIEHPGLTEDDLHKAVYYFREDGSVCYGADAVFLTFTHMHMGFFNWIFRHVPGVKWSTRKMYALVSANRPIFSKVSRFLYGSSYHPSTYIAVKSFFLRGLGVIYVMAFLSLWVQVQGLYGAHGILPIAAYLQRAFEVLGTGAYLRVPSVFWVNASDVMLSVVCGVGVAASVLVIWGRFRALGLFLAWICYLSFVTTGQDFLSFQWDVLLLEVGFLALFLNSKVRVLSGISHWLLCWTLFRLMLSSGLVKLLSMDPVWRDGIALTFHYWTQPLPHIGGWLMYQMPLWFHKTSCWMMFFVELVVVWGILLPRRIRFWAFWPLFGLQFVIMFTGNYGFFNLLMMLLCLLMLTDHQLITRWPFRLFRRDKGNGVEGGWVGATALTEQSVRLNQRRMTWMAGIGTLFLGYLFLVSISLESNRFLGRDILPAVVQESYVPLSSFQLVNGYGLFAVMTKSRLELVIEGSTDGVTWKPYGFKFKPQDPSKMPLWVMPHQPRLDWQFWFASLQSPRFPYWMRGLGQGIAEQNPAVLGLLGENPFPGQAPTFLRVTGKMYKFSTMDRRFKEDVYWDVSSISQ